jgi:hypothetical protein
MQITINCYLWHSATTARLSAGTPRPTAATLRHTAAITPPLGVTVSRTRTSICPVMCYCHLLNHVLYTPHQMHTAAAAITSTPATAGARELQHWLSRHVARQALQANSWQVPRSRLTFVILADHRRRPRAVRLL